MLYQIWFMWNDCSYSFSLLSQVLDVLELGNLNAERDWGFAGDYVKAMWLMLQRDTPEDFVIASGEKHSVREFTNLAFEHLGIRIVWKGTGIDEVGIDSDTGKVLVRVSERYFRPAEVDLLLGDCKRAKEVLKWEPTCGFKDLVKLMVDEDMKLLESVVLQFNLTLLL
ncbi:unnamed protein product [Heterobilharzia americana]|nr:unnamed protein product [Heterobilharzia americana]